MVYLIGAAVLAGLLGFAAHGADVPAEYVPRLRLLFLGAAGIGYLSVAVFIWRKSRGWKRWISLFVGLIAARIAYLPAVHLSVLVTAWLTRAGRALGAGDVSLPVHYCLGVFTATFVILLALLAILAATSLHRVRWSLLFAGYVLLGVFAFAHPDDRTVLPHPFRGEASAPTTLGPGYWTVVRDRDRAARGRVLALAESLRHLVMPRSGWGGAVREELLARHRGNPDASLSERVSALEGGLLKARAQLRTSPRTPRESAARRQPGRS